MPVITEKGQDSGYYSSLRNEAITCSYYFCKGQREAFIMINKKLSMVFLMGTLVLLTSCMPLYEMWIKGAWEVDEYYKNGVEETQSFYLIFGDYVITFHPDGYFTETYTWSNILPVTNSGTWNFINNAQQLSLVDQGSTRIFDVKSLTKAEMRLYRELDEGEYEELVLEPKGEV